MIETQSQPDKTMRRIKDKLFLASVAVSALVIIGANIVGSIYGWQASGNVAGAIGGFIAGGIIGTASVIAVDGIVDEIIEKVRRTKDRDYPAFSNHVDRLSKEKNPGPSPSSFSQEAITTTSSPPHPSKQIDMS
jgi:hypothetical protein